MENHFPGTGIRPDTGSTVDRGTGAWCCCAAAPILLFLFFLIFVLGVAVGAGLRSLF